MMAKAYWMVSYRKVKDPQRVAEYSKLATPAIANGGGRILARGAAAFAHEAGLIERTVLTEFDSLQQAVSAFESVGYQAALKILGTAAERDFRIVEGVE